MAAAVGLSALGALAQQRSGWDASARLEAGLLPRRPDLENLLRTGQDALARRDWKLAIDSLQRIIDDESGALLPAGESAGGFRLRESARRRATALLAGMPPEGLSAYRLLTDGKAENLWVEVQTRGDEAALRTLVDKYLMTGRGDDAADLLAAILIDRGQPADALDVLERLDTWRQGGDVPANRLARKRAVCWLMLGEPARAETALGEAVDTVPQDEATEVIAGLVAGGWQGAGDATADPLVETWPRVGGDLVRSRHMPATSPELREDLPWRFALQVEDSDWWAREYLPNREFERGLPVAEPVVADGRVFVKWVNQVVALDLESLDFLWQTYPSPETSTTPYYRLQAGAMFRGGQVFEGYSQRDRYLHDYVGSALAVAGGLVFEVDRNGVGLTGRRPGDRVTVERGGGESVWRGSRLIAHRVENGDIAWQRGRTADPADPLGDVHFLGVPLALPQRGAAGGGSELWTVYARRNDICLGVLDPADGALRRELLLCSVDALELDTLLHEAVYPACDGRTLYVSLSAGLVLAVDVDTLALRWATEYPREPHVVNSLAPASWLCGPPLVSGRVVLAAPPDSSRLLALDRASGAVLWSYDRPAQVFYVLGADARRVWVGGDDFACLALETGEELWHGVDVAELETTGRAAWSGAVIHVPTDAGLVTVAADSGAVVGQKPLPADQLPLGNLLCLASALFSVDTNEVRKFPDLTISYPRQLARFEAEPKNEQAAVRLAWMELLRGEPRRTLAVLSALRPAARTQGRYRSEISRLTIDAMLRVASAPATSDTEAVELLESALASTQRDLDQLRATLALAARWRKMGRGDEAYLRLWRLGLGSAGDGYVTIEQGLRNKARLVIAGVLARFERDLTARQLATIQAETQRALAEAVALTGEPASAEEGHTRLVQLAELDDAGGAGEAALVALGKSERDARRFERSEQYLREAIRRNRAPAVTATALRDLAEQYLSAEQNLHWEAQRLLAELEQGYGDQMLATDTGAVAVADEVARLRAQIDPGRAARGAGYADRSRIALSAEPSGERIPHLSANSLVEYLGAPMEAASRLALLYQQPGTLLALPPGEQRVRWAAELATVGPDGAGAGAGDVAAGDEGAGGWPQEFHALAYCDGQTAVLNGPDGLFGVGLLTGRRLWGIPYEETATADRAALRNRLMAVDRGRLICAPRRGVLTCSSVLDGGEVRWERILADERIDTLALKDDFCLTLDNRRERATAYAADTGRRIARVAFHQPGEVVGPIPLIYEGGQLVGPVDARTVASYALGTGQESWRYAMPEDIRWAFNAGEGFIGVCSVEGHLRLLDAYEGDVLLAVQLPEVAAGYAEGILKDGALLLMAATRTSRGPDPVLISLDTASGAVRWRRDGFGPTGASQFALWKLLTVADDVLPMFRRVDTASSSAFDATVGRVAVEIVDKRTGETVGPTVETAHAVTLNERLNGEFGFWPGHLLLGSERGILVLSTAGEAARTPARSPGGEATP